MAAKDAHRMTWCRREEAVDRYEVALPPRDHCHKYLAVVSEMDL
jgi:hypothetical protein